MGTKWQTRAVTTLRGKSSVPGYHSRLPAIFPYFWNGSLQDVRNLVGVLLKGEEDLSLGLWFAVTGHPLTQDGHVTLWLSTGAAKWLLEWEYVATIYQHEKVRT